MPHFGAVFLEVRKKLEAPEDGMHLAGGLGQCRGRRALIAPLSTLLQLSNLCPKSLYEHFKGMLSKKTLQFW